jgi:IclR family KDG regulon transcriptional repressor
MLPTVPALTRALDILELFLKDGHPRSIPEITRELQLPRSTVHDLIKTLADRSYLNVIESSPRRYSPGLRLFQLGSLYRSGVDPQRLSQQVAAEVANRCDETVHVAILDNLDAVYIAKADTSQAVRLVSSIGAILPANCTAGGKVLLSSLSDYDLDNRVAASGPLKGMTKRSVSSLSKLKAELEKIRSGGLGFEYCESNEHAACLAAPVYGADGAIVAAISMTVPVVRWSEDQRPEREQIIIEGAARLSSLLGFMGTESVVRRDTPVPAGSAS